MAHLRHEWQVCTCENDLFGQLFCGSLHGIELSVLPVQPWHGYKIDLGQAQLGRTEQLIQF